MPSKKPNTTTPDQFIALLFTLPWLDILAETCKLLRSLWRSLTDEGMYDVLEHESTLELLDYQGTRAGQVKRRLDANCSHLAHSRLRASSSTPATYLTSGTASLSLKASSSRLERRRSDKWRPTM